MKHLHIITPVKDSMETAVQTIQAIVASKFKMPVKYTVYNDYSTPETTAELTRLSQELGFELVNLCDLTDHPSPNYLLVLQRSQQRALAEDAGLIIVESDVTVQPDTIQGLVDGAIDRPDCGIAASATVDQDGIINYPYKKNFSGKENQVVDTRRHCSFCCSLLTPALLKAYDFNNLDPEKNWYDVTISHKSLECGLHNYVFATLPVLHRPHASRPWKQLKYKNPLLYYWRKFTKKMDRI